MKFALINPNWTYDGSIYFGCRHPHLPLEFGYAQALLERAGHQALILDAHLFDLSTAEVQARIADFQPDFTVIATAPTYLFWRCPPPELRLPAAVARLLRHSGGGLLAVGPHASTTPGATIDKLGVDAVIRGEFEEILPHFADPDWRKIPGIAFRQGKTLYQCGEPWQANLHALPPLSWPDEWLARHRHQHHRFDAQGAGSGAEIESSRGCPYRCSFCAKENFRGLYRKRPLGVLLREIDGLLRQGVEYLYFIDEIFLPDSALLTALASRRLRFGIQTRIDLWQLEMLEALGRAGCVSIEAGVESLSELGRQQLGKPCRLSTREISERLIFAKEHVPFVQANLLLTDTDHPTTIAAWRKQLIAAGVWANDPVPLFPFPGSPAYRQRWGHPDDSAWERAHAWYLRRHSVFCDLQDGNPLPLEKLDRTGGVDA
ncbi:MAG: TIGR04295 family B12-binding domain-containing radical SAM protein [Desulfuromonadales bacterium]|jgi:B12-binding domain/radical SAM domain protein of rhizo-twelve system